MIKKSIIYSVVCVFWASFCLGQTVLTNADGTIHVDKDAVIYVEGDVLVESNGTIDNSGTIHVENDWINNSLLNVFVNSSPGLVNLFGGNQLIIGTSPTRFYNLTTLTPSLKTIGVNTWVENKLNLTSSEVTLNNNILHLFNPHPDSLLWTTGFISGDSIGGYFLRSTDRSVEYFFPVGSLNLLNTYRAVSIIPTTSDSTVFGVRLADVDPATDFTGTSITGSTGPFPRTLADDPLAINKNEDFYHHIARFHGTANGQSRIFYFSSDEPSFRDYNSAVFWDNSNPRYVVSNFGVASPASLFSIGSPDRSVVSNGLDFSDDIYVLSVKDEMEVFVPQIFSPNGDGLNDVLFAYGNRFESLRFSIYNRWGEKVFETTESTIGWDGKFRGVDAQAGVYVYYVEAQIRGFGDFSQKGDITLVR